MSRSASLGGMVAAAVGLAVPVLEDHRPILAVQPDIRSEFQWNRLIALEVPVEVWIGPVAGEQPGDARGAIPQPHAVARRREIETHVGFRHGEAQYLEREGQLHSLCVRRCDQEGQAQQRQTRKPDIELHPGSLPHACRSETRSQSGKGRRSTFRRNS